MNLRAYYYQKYGNDFDVFLHFIYTNGLNEDFSVQLEVSNDYIVGIEELILYDYFFSAIDYMYINKGDQNYDLLFFKKIIDEDFIKFCISSEGKEIMNETHLYFGVKQVDIFDVIYDSREHFDKIDYPSVITNAEYFKFLDKYVRIKYLKDVKILSMLRTFIDNGGFGGEFYAPQSESIKKYTDFIMEGVLRVSDKTTFDDNIEEFRNILDIDYLNVYE